MAVISNKNSKSHKRNRRGHIALEVPNIVLDKTTGEYTVAHHVSPKGLYKGRQVIAAPKQK
ncbi:50S ribosomal protein L32 [Oenococcus oeni IOEB_9304]|uniref:50S ribosomal protein L32 n=1 Tax=Oenococcus oeni TaxID=1247 RepID=UPI0005101EF6|nr:50S ribosomal protein L32 [Oenococcus oeni]KGH78346.1 50S ribosomal protein L32 [Oenococcus oeni IOEB_9304]KGH88130.1 50S ribosomal protein L32 [Oenococcus oeni IOEB_C28]